MAGPELSIITEFDCTVEKLVVAVGVINFDRTYFEKGG
jgi:hypothetical protein